MDQGFLAESVLYVIVLVLSLTVHEWAHAMSAYLLGDDTAARQGRLTLNPIPHIDPIGTLLLPLMHIPFGWARPVPVNPTRFRRNVNSNKGMMLTSAAGPLSNVILAFLCIAIYLVFMRFQPQLLAVRGVRELLSLGAQINVSLAVFNMLPIPPLDGGRVAEGLVPYRHRDWWESFKSMAPMLLLFIIVMPRFVGYSIIEVPAQAVFEVLIDSAHWLVGST
jgi:Zn-dependent protease